MIHEKSPSLRFNCLWCTSLDTSLLDISLFVVSVNIEAVNQQYSLKMNTVEVRGAYKYYGKSKDPKVVLNKLNMTVSAGSM